MTAKAKTGADYERYKERQAQISAERSRSGRDIAPLPKVVNPERRRQAGESLEFYCRTYFPEVFSLPWSADHRRMLTRIEQAVRVGGLSAYAMPRGTGKTSLAEKAVEWAVIYAYRQFALLIGSDESAAQESLDTIKTDFETNDLLLEDFPEICYPIRRLDGIANRSNGQLLSGKRTHIEWTATGIVLPTVAGSAASGAIIAVTGITGRIRGMKYARPGDGRNVRPDLVIPDDPQTDESARSPSQCAVRTRILTGAVLGLAGPGKKISGVMPCTVINPGDMADEILDRDKHPEWRGERTKLVYKWPDAWDTLWQQYKKIRGDGLRAEDEGRAGTEFYRANREAMDRGSEIAWPARFNSDELSALQHAANLRFDYGESAFFAEYQNDPLPEEAVDDDVLTADQIAEKINNLDRGELPIDVAKVTAFIDVQKTALFWVVCGWAEDFTGYVVDYGVFPKQQGREYFALREIRHTLQSVLKTKSLEAAIYGGLETLTADLCSRKFRRDDAAELTIERCLIDANWGESSDVIYKFCRESAHSAVLTPSHGIGVGATSRPFNDYRRKRGDRIGDHWRMPVLSKGVVRRVVYDTNHWKSFAQARFAVPIGGPGCLSIFGSEPQDHKLFADHQTAELPVVVQAKGRTVTEWKIKNTRPDNHWKDGLVGNFVAASIQGVSLEERKASTVVKRPRMKLSDIQAAKRARR
jgi:hypothetical protein